MILSLLKQADAASTRTHTPAFNHNRASSAHVKTTQPKNDNSKQYKVVIKKLDESTNMKNNNNSRKYFRNLTLAKTTATTTLPKFKHEEHVAFGRRFESSHKPMPGRRTGLLEKRKTNEDESVRFNPSNEPTTQAETDLIEEEDDDYYDIRFDPSSSYKSNYNDPRKSISYSSHKIINDSLASRRSSIKSGFAYSKNVHSTSSAASHTNENFDSYFNNPANHRTSVSYSKMMQQRPSRTAYTTSPKRKSMLFHEITLNDLCVQPKKLHMAAFLSVEGQYSMIKSYEDLMRDELLKAYPNQSTLPKSTSPRVNVTPDETAKKTSPTHFFKNADNLNQAYKKYLKKDEVVKSEDELKKVKISHFIESATKILDIIDETTNNKKHEPHGDQNLLVPKSSSNVNHQSADIGPSPSFDFEHPLDLYSKWVDLLNKELK